MYSMKHIKLIESKGNNMKTKKIKIEQAKSYEHLCTSLLDQQFDVEPSHKPNPLWIMDGGATCVECGGFVPNDDI